MKDVLELVTTWGVGTLLTAAALFGFFPKFVVHLIVLIYPRNHARRRELPAEIEVVPYRERLIWAFGQCATVLFEAVPARVGDIRSRRRERVRQLPKPPDTELLAQVTRYRRRSGTGR